MEFSSLLLLASGNEASPGLLFDLTVLFALALGVVFVCERVRLPAIVGFLITGAIAGPKMAGFVTETTAVERLSDIGIVLLLFTIGMELSIKSLLQLRVPAFFGGSIQIALTALCGFALSKALSFPTNEAIFHGILISLSCTVIALKIMEQRGEMEAPHGRTAFGILIFQDLMVIPIVMLLPLLVHGGGAEGGGTPVHYLLAKVVGVAGFVFLAARYAVPWVFYRVASMRDRELFLLCVLVVGMTIAWATTLTGMSLAMGAFIAGLIISESEYSHRALASIMPFKDVFISLFFISTGMMLDVGVILADPAGILALTALVLVVKVLLAGAAVVALGYPPKVAVRTAFLLAGMGEFSFVLAKEGLTKGLLTEEFFQTFLAVSVLSLAAAPLIALAAPATVRFLRLDRLAEPPAIFGLETVPTDTEISNHLILIGYGPTGQLVARAAKGSEIPFLVIEMNPQTVRDARRREEPVYYGDASSEVVLEHARVRDARILIVVISDPSAARRITQVARSLNPRLHIVVRMRFLSEIEPLRQLGANEVIPDEFEAGLELMTRMLRHFLVPREDVDSLLEEFRANGYRAIREEQLCRLAHSGVRDYLSTVDIHMMEVGPRYPMGGKTLAEVNLRARFGVTVLAVQRAGQVHENPGASFGLEDGDQLIVLGLPKRLSGMVQKLVTDPIPLAQEPAG